MALLLYLSIFYHQSYSESLFTYQGPFHPQSSTIIGYSDVVDTMMIEFDMTFHAVINSWGGILSIGANYDERLPMILMQQNENWLNFNVATSTTWSDDSCDVWGPSNGRFLNGGHYHLHFFFNQTACGYSINGTLIHANYQHPGHPIIGQRPIYIDTLPNSSPAQPANITIRNLVIWTPSTNAFVTIDPTHSPTPSPTSSTMNPTNAPVTLLPTPSPTYVPTKSPNTHTPTTDIPKSYPTSSNPTTYNPTTSTPTTSDPTTNAPTTYEPTTSMPTTNSPTTSTPTTIYPVSQSPTISNRTAYNTLDIDGGESGEINVETTVSDNKLNKGDEKKSVSYASHLIFYSIGAATCCICILFIGVLIIVKKHKQHKHNNHASQKYMTNDHEEIKHCKYDNNMSSRSPTSQNNKTQISDESECFQRHLSSVIVGSDMIMNDIIYDMNGSNHVTAGGPIHTNEIDLDENQVGEGDFGDTMDIIDDDEQEIIEMVNMVTPNGGDNEINSPLSMVSMAHQSNYNVMNDSFVLSQTKGNVINPNIKEDEFIVEDEYIHGMVDEQLHEHTTKGYIGNEYNNDKKRNVW